MWFKEAERYSARPHKWMGRGYRVGVDAGDELEPFPWGSGVGRVAAEEGLHHVHLIVVLPDDKVVAEILYVHEMLKDLGQLPCMPQRPDSP